METIIIILFVIVSFALTFFIILQPGKGGGMGALGGGGGSGGGPGGSMFGARGAVPFLAKMTVWFGIAFGVLVLVLARLNIDRPTIGLDAPEAVIPTESLPGGGAGAPEGAEGGVVVPTEGDAPTDPATGEAPAEAPAAADPAAGEAPTEAPAPAPAAADPAAGEAPTEAPAPAPAAADPAGAENVDGE